MVASQPAPATPVGQVTMKVHAGTYERLTAIKADMKAERNREIPYTDVIEYLLECREQLIGVLSREAGR
jgi:hypothetical protein